MSARFPPEWHFGLRLVLAFVFGNLLFLPLLPIYARLVVPVVQWSLMVLKFHDAQIVFTDIYPDVRWQFSYLSQVRDEHISFRLLSYNLILYFSLLMAISIPVPRRIFFILSGLPILFMFHTADLMLAVESKYLTWVQPGYYAFWKAFDLWFVVVKFYHSFSVMALKQVFPILLLWLQWRGLGRRL